MRTFFHQKLPTESMILSGRGPVPPQFGFQSDQLQVFFAHDDASWSDERAQAHLECDECFLVLKGAIVLDVEGEERVIKAREYAYFPPGVFHRIVRVETPVEAFVIRAPSVEDKVYRDA